MIVGVIGKAQHGKDSIGQRLVDSWGYQRFAFADALKSLALTLNPWVDFERVRTTDPVIMTDKVYHRLADYVSTYGWETAKQTVEVRRFLQVLGTEGVRDHIGPSAWIDALERSWIESEAQDAVITDVRFPNEAAFIKRHGGRLIKVVRPNFENGAPAHASEVYADSAPVDFTIVNDGDLTDLQARVDAIAADLDGFLAESYR